MNYNEKVDISTVSNLNCHYNQFKWCLYEMNTISKINGGKQCKYLDM